MKTPSTIKYEKLSVTHHPSLLPLPSSLCTCFQAEPFNTFLPPIVPRHRFPEAMHSAKQTRDSPQHLPLKAYTLPTQCAEGNGRIPLYVNNLLLLISKDGKNVLWTANAFICLLWQTSVMCTPCSVYAQGLALQRGPPTRWFFFSHTGTVALCVHWAQMFSQPSSTRMNNNSKLTNARSLFVQKTYTKHKYWNNKVFFLKEKKVNK